MNGSKIVLSLLAHPDDAEFTCAGTLALLHGKGWEIHIATMTPGDCGTTTLSREEISRIRKAEAAQSAQILDGTYHCLECGDVFVMYDEETLRKAVSLLREVQPAVVFAPSPSDYMVDHEITAKIAQTACFAAGMKNIETAETGLLETVPHLYYVDAVDGNDAFGKEIKPEILVDISSVIATKEQMLCCHDSQRSWLLQHHGVDEYIAAMKEFAASRGEEINCGFAEGFRQHLGHAYPQDNILQSELGALVYDN